MNRSILLYPLGDVNEYREVTYIYNLEKRTSKLPVLWLCEKLGNVEKVVFIITKKTRDDYYSLFEKLCEFMLKRGIEKIYGENLVKRFKKREDFDTDKKLFLERLRSETHRDYSFLVIDEENLTSFINDLKRYMGENEDYTFHIDITHSYRFISMFITIALSLLKNAGISVRLGEILYAFGGSSSENKIISLKDYIEVIDWSQSIFTFKSSGNIRAIAESLQNIANKLSRTLNILQCSLDMNFAPKIRESLQKLNEELNNLCINNPVFSEIILGEVKKMLSEFKLDGKQSEFELSLAKWHLRNNRYLHGYIALTESIITKLCEVYELDLSKREEREKAKTIALPLRSKETNHKYTEFATKHIKEINELYESQKSLSIFFNEITNIRNCFAHIKDISEEGEVQNIYLKALKFANEGNPCYLNKNIRWTGIDEIYKDIEKLPSLFPKNRLEELGNIYKELQARRQGNV